MLHNFSMNNLLRSIAHKLSLQTPSILKGLKKNMELKSPHYYYKSFGTLNKNITFYVIRRSPGTGLFSNLTFVLNHLQICKKFGFTPIVDMQNFNTIYNEEIKIKKTFNSWEYFFEPLNKYTLEEVYKSKNVIITSDIFYHFFSYSINLNIELTKLLQTEIKIKKTLYKTFERLCKKFSNKKILGVHFRGTSYKSTAGHPFPATEKQMYFIINSIMKKNKVDHIFLVTEELRYLDYLKKKFPNKITYLNTCYRSNKNDAFKIYPRKLHRYKLGREAVIEALLLSKCDYLIHLSSNITSAAIAFNLNNNQKRFEINNGQNSKNRFIAAYLWYLRKILPSNYGGFKNQLNG